MKLPLHFVKEGMEPTLLTSKAVVAHCAEEFRRATLPLFPQGRANAIPHFCVRQTPPDGALRRRYMVEQCRELGDQHRMRRGLTVQRPKYGSCGTDVQRASRPADHALKPRLARDQVVLYGSPVSLSGRPERQQITIP